MYFAVTRLEKRNITSFYDFEKIIFDTPTGIIAKYAKKRLNWSCPNFNWEVDTENILKDNYYEKNCILRIDNVEEERISFSEVISISGLTANSLTFVFLNQKDFRISKENIGTGWFCGFSTNIHRHRDKEYDSRVIFVLDGFIRKEGIGGSWNLIESKNMPPIPNKAFHTIESPS